MESESDLKKAVWDRIQRGDASPNDFELVRGWGNEFKNDALHAARPYELWLMENGDQCLACWNGNGFSPLKVEWPLNAILLFAATYGKSDTDNGGMHQFFSNATGNFAPETKLGLELMGMADAAMIIGEAMALFGEQYPRSRLKRYEQVNMREEEFEKFDERFYRATTGYHAAADRFYSDIFFPPTSKT